MSMNPAQRIAKWHDKFNTERIKGALDDSLERMYVNVQSVFPQITSMEEQVKQVLDLQGISTMYYGMYLCFGRQVWSLQRRGVSGDSLAMECATLVARWVARGLSLSILEIIRSQVFNVPAPAGP
jgi:hypothetical protein